MLSFELDKVQSFLVGTYATADVLDCFYRIKGVLEAQKTPANSASTKLLAELNEAVLHSFSGDAYLKTDLYNKVREQLRVSGA